MADYQEIATYQAKKAKSRERGVFEDIFGVICEHVSVSDFTDGGSTSGYVDLTDPLPENAIPIGWRCVVDGAFDNDTSAVVQIGISGDTDSFSADTAESVFTTGTVGSLALADAALNGIGSTATVRVTVTGSSDFTSIVSSDNGAMTVSLYYLIAV